MGGDLGPRPCVCAAEKFAMLHPEVKIVLFGSEAAIRKALTCSAALAHSLQIVDVPDYVHMHDSPGMALRRKRNSSMWHALQALAESRAEACVSAGNTGALMAMGRHIVKTLPGINRPAIGKYIPTRREPSLLLDLGANLSCSAEMLYQFACMGAALARANGVAVPKLALLNVGSELSKGNDAVRGAAKLIHARQHRIPVNFQGFVEGDELYSGSIDVIVCDGFAGNVALKVSEGLVRHLTASLEDYINARWFTRAARVLMRPLLSSWAQKRNPALSNGAAFLGLQKTVIKSHGSADIPGLFAALEAAREQILAQTPSKIAASMASLETQME